MKIARNILIVLCVAVTGFFIIYAKIQTDHAMEFQKETVRLQTELEHYREAAEKSKELATLRAAEAVRAHNRAMEMQEQLEECNQQ